MSDDRTIHGMTVYGKEIVRYDRAGKWYVEWPGERQRISIAHAASMAAQGTAYLNLPGGQRFDAIVRRFRAAVSEETP